MELVIFIWVFMAAFIALGGIVHAIEGDRQTGARIALFCWAWPLAVPVGLVYGFYWLLMAALGKK